MTEPEKNLTAAAEEIRAFHRFYLPAMRLLGNHYLGSDAGGTEIRVLYELYHQPGCSAADIARSLHIDKSYLSRILRRYEKKNWVRRVPSKNDRRSSELYLTESGRSQSEYYFRKSNQEVAAQIQSLSPKERDQLLEAMKTITALLKKAEKKGAAAVPQLPTY